METGLAVREHSFEEADIDGGDVSRFHIADEMFFHHIWEGGLYVEEEDGDDFLHSPCVFDLLDYKVHSISGTSTWSAAKLHWGK